MIFTLIKLDSSTAMFKARVKRPDTDAILYDDYWFTMGQSKWEKLHRPTEIMITVEGL